MTFIEMDRATKRGFHEDVLEGRPRNGEETSVITPGGFQPVVREVADFETRFRGGDLAPQLAVGSLLRVSEEGLEHFEIVGVGNGSGLQGKSAPGLTDGTDANGPLGFDQKVIDLISDLVHLPDNGRGSIDDNLAA